MITPEQIERYLNGDCTEIESIEVEAWYHSFESKTDYISGLDQEQEAVLKERLQKAIREKILATEPAQIAREPVPPARTFRIPLFMKIAASLLITSGLGYLARDFLTNTFSAKDPLLKVENTRHNLQKLTLPDSSTVWIYPGTNVKYGQFTGDSREIWLTGEAFFEITRDTLRPFLIHSGNLTTRVLGTSFEITAWPEDSTASVSVKSGKVAVLANNSAAQASAKNGPAAPKENYMILTSSQKAVFSKKNNEFTKEAEDLHPEMKIWTSMSLSFNNVPLTEVAQVLSERFGVEVSIDKEQMGNCTIRADFTDQNLPTIIDLICKSVAAEYIIMDKGIFISGKGCDISNNSNQPIIKETI